MLLLPLALAGEADTGAPADTPEGSGEVVVEAEGRDVPDPNQTAASVTVIEVDETLPASADVASVVEQASGTVVRRLGGLGDWSAVSIRGSSFRQVQVYLDGVPLNPDGSASVNLSELPLRAFSRVELYRGNAPAHFGAAPIGGVVHLVSGDGPLPPGLALATGAHGTWKASGHGGAQTELGTTPVDGLLLAEAFSTQGDFSAFSDNATLYDRLDDTIETRQNNDKRQLNLHGRVRVGSERLRLSLVDALLMREEGLPGPITAQASATRLGTQRNLLVAQVEGRRAPLRGAARAWWHQRSETYDDREGEVGVGSQWHQDHTRSIGALAHGVWAPVSWLLPGLTLTGRSDQAQQTDLRTGEADEARVRRAGAVALNADLFAWGERIRLSPVLHTSLLDQRDLGTLPNTAQPVVPSDQETMVRVLPRAGLLVRPLGPNLAFKANAGQFFRPPDLSELFGDRGASVGNPDLLPEQGWQWDVGARWVWPHSTTLPGAVEATAFWNDVQDQIVYVQSGQGVSVPVNLGRGWTQGIESALHLDALGWVDSQSNFTWTLSRNLTPRQDVADKQLPRVPQTEFAQTTSVHWQEHVRVGHGFSHTAGNYWDATNFFATPPRVLHDVFLRVGWAGFSLEGTVLNVGDRIVGLVDRNPLDAADDQRVVAPLQDFSGFPLPGRTWLLTLRWDPPLPDRSQS